MAIIHYSCRQKMSDLITNSAVLSVVERLNIDFGFGEASVGEICHQYQLSPDLFILICKVYANNNANPNIANLTARDIPKIVEYLQQTHKYWLNSCLPHLHNNIHIMLDNCDANNKKMLNKFYDDYDEEVQKHLYYEEKIVFPYILSLVADKYSDKYSISNFAKNHSDLEEKLHDLKNIVIKYLPENGNRNIRIEVLNDIFKFENDIRKHSIIENKILVPLVSKIEKI